MPVNISFKVNGEQKTVSTESDRTLLDVLREDLDLTGTKYGCGKGQCGACTVLIDGKAVKSCLISAIQADGKEIVTIEGLAEGDVLHPVQEAFIEEGALQCGYCTSGMIMAATVLLEKNPTPTDDQIVSGMNSNICRCNGYPKIFKAVRRASEKMRRGRS